MTQYDASQRVSLDDTSEVRGSHEELGYAAIARVGPAIIVRETYLPGWHWAQHMRPKGDDETCQMPHHRYVISGHLRIRMDTGEELELGPGDACYIAPGHDAWVVGDQPCVMLDFHRHRG